MPPALPGQRPAPPAKLDDTERRVWEAITGALPPTWFDADALQMLLRAVTQGAESLEAQLRALRAQVIATSACGRRKEPFGRSAGRQMAQVRKVRPWEVSEEASPEG